MNAKTFILILSQVPPDAEITLLIKPEWKLIADDLDEALESCPHELACESETRSTDIVLAAVEGFDTWLIARQPVD